MKFIVPSPLFTVLSTRTVLKPGIVNWLLVSLIVSSFESVHASTARLFFNSKPLISSNLFPILLHFKWQKIIPFALTNSDGSNEDILSWVEGWLEVRSESAFSKSDKFVGAKV